MMNISRSAQANTNNSDLA